MATVQERARFVGWLFETKSVTQTQRNYRNDLACAFTRHNTTGYFLWGYVKNSVFRRAVNGLEILKTRISNAISAIPADMLHRTWQELEYYLDVLRAIKEAQSEVF
jgi:hypothetical protein